MKYEKENVEIQVLLNSINYSLLGSTDRYLYLISNIDHKVKIINHSEKPRVRSSNVFLHAHNIKPLLKN